MNDTKKRKSPLAEPGGQLYAFLCLTGLGVIVILQLGKMISGPGMLLLLVIFLFGVLGIVVRIGGALLWMLALFAASELLEQFWLERFLSLRAIRVSWELQPDHVLLCFGFLAYAIGLYRLQAIGGSIFPVDPRRWQKSDPKKKGKKPKYRLLRVKRPAAQVSTVEVLLALAALPVCTALAELSWYWLTNRERVLGFVPNATRMMYFLWILLVGAFVVISVLRYWRGAARTGEQAELFLQDAVWHDTRREQRYIHRWLAWAEIRQANKEKNRM